MKTTWRTNRTQSGSALVEVVFSIAVIGVVAAALIGSFSYGFFITQLVRENQRATQIILEKAETIRLYSWDQVLTPGFIPSTFTDVYDPQSAGGEGVAYHGTLTIGNSPSGANYSANLRQFTITLTWTNHMNMVRTRSLATLVAKDGIQNYVY